MNIKYYVNYFSQEGHVSSDQERSFEHIIAALRQSQNCTPRLIIKCTPGDVNLLADKFSSVLSSDIAQIEPLGPDSHHRRLPFLRDILLPDPVPSTKAASISPASNLPSYAIYANADICIPPWFFDFVAQQIMQAHCGRATPFQPEWTAPDALIINRRDLLPGSSSMQTSQALPRFDWHPGYDLFVFPHALLPRLVLGDVCVGLPPVGALLTLNLLVHCRRVSLIDDLFISWHHGSDRRWEGAEHQAAIRTNSEAAAQAFRILTGHDRSVLQRLPFVGFERNLAHHSYRSLAEGWRQVNLP